MPVTIEVYRGDGARPGNEISDVLIGDSLEVALSRGRAELDAHAHAWKVVTLECGYRPELALGHLVSIDDPVQGALWTGKVTGIAHQHDGIALATTLTVRRPA